MMLFALLKKDFLIVRKYVLMMLVVIVLIPSFILWRVPEFTGVLGFMLSVIFGIFILLQYVSLKEYQFPKAATLLCATPFSRKEFVLSKYIFCLTIYIACCIVFEIIYCLRRYHSYEFCSFSNIGNSICKDLRKNKPGINKIKSDSNKPKNNDTVYHNPYTVSLFLTFIFQFLPQMCDQVFFRSLSLYIFQVQNPFEL